MKQPLIAPSILASDFMNLEREIKMIEESQADWIHVDVMDGVFVPNISFGMPIIKQLKPIAQKPLDVHLMIVDPDRYLDTFADLGADHITVHLEACNHLHRTLNHIRQLGLKSGVALNPHSRIDLIEDCIEDIDIICLMGVNPGFGGQKFIPKTIDKIKQLRSLLDRNNSNALIEIDGGVDLGNAHIIHQAGADVLVAGSAVFKSVNPEQMILDLKKGS
jgi:ribulose-phosphate 3-epimerase